MAAALDRRKHKDRREHNGVYRARAHAFFIRQSSSGQSSDSRSVTLCSFLEGEQEQEEDGDEEDSNIHR